MVLRPSPYRVTVPFAAAWNSAAHREVDAALAVGRQVVDDAAKAIERIAVRQLVGEDPPLRRHLRHVLTQAALHHERLALLVHRERAAGVRVRVDRRDLAAAVELDDRAVVVLRDQETAVLVGEDAVGVVAAGFPYLGPFLTGSNDAGDLRDGVFSRRRRESGRSGAAPAAGGAPPGRGAAAGGSATAPWRRRGGGGVLQVAISA